MLEITNERAAIIKNEAIDIYRQQQKLPFRSQPDPLKAKLELVYILYITEKIDGIEDLQELSCVSEFLQFFLDSENFDYGKVDFSNYMWENISRHSKFMNKIVEHRDDIIPNIEARIETDTATEHEKKILYGFLMDKDKLL